jgi:hypothetical protein
MQSSTVVPARSGSADAVQDNSRHGPDRADVQGLVRVDQIRLEIIV